MVAAVGREAMLGERGGEVEGAAGRWRGGLGGAWSGKGKDDGDGDEEEEGVKAESRRSHRRFRFERGPKPRVSLFFLLFS